MSAGKHGVGVKNNEIDYQIPAPLSPLGSYPNPFAISDAMRQEFHPIVKFPDGDIQVLDFTKPRAAHVRELATDEEREQVRLGQPGPARSSGSFMIGRYDEDRVGLYESDLFDKTDNVIQGYQGRRTVHMGIDLDGPVGTPVHAFTDGVIHKAGYNAELGDYGHVIVVRHNLANDKTVYCLYGHLDASATATWHEGDTVAGGHVLGRMGDIHDNGGWMIPHVHVQLSVQAPVTHDLPGVVAPRDRAQALVDYPDPRYVTGPLY